MPQSTNPPPLPKGHKANYETLLAAAKSGHLALVSAIRKSDQKPVALLCAMNFDGEFYSPVPLAEMVNGNPYDIYEDPTTFQEDQHGKDKP